MAHRPARVATAARETCQSYGLQPHSPAFRACSGREARARSLPVFTDQQLDIGPQLAKP